MADILSGFPDKVDEVTAPIAEISGEVKKKHTLSKKELKILKMHTKALRKYNKLMAQEAARRKNEGESAEKEAAKNINKSQSDGAIKMIGRKLIDAVCRAIPTLLTTLATRIVDAFIKAKLAGNIKQAA